MVDTATFWSGFGHVVIFVLCEIGGLGVMTLTSLALMRLSRRLGLRARASASTEVGGLDPGNVKSVVFAVGRVALIVQSAIALILTLRFYLHYDYDLRQSAWYGVFHSASAFNNLGFALFTDNLVGFVTDWWIIIPISFGIVVGGLGLPVLLEVWTHRRTLYRAARRRRWTIHTRIMIYGTIVLLVVGFGLFLLTEWTNNATLGQLSVPGKFLGAIGLSVFPRTGGFNSVDITDLRSESWFITDVLMFIGAGPAGTGGGLKITTVAVLAAIWITEVRGNPDTRVFDRTVTPAAQRGAIAVASAFTTTILVATGLMLAMTPYTLSAVFTEVTSAMSTVGLSTGITSSLNTAEQFLLMLLMFIGRLGPITFATAIALNTRTTHYSLPEERPYIG